VLQKIAIDAAIKKKIEKKFVKNRLTASGRLIEFGSINRPESWRFESTRPESLGGSIPKVGIENRVGSSRFLGLKPKPDPKNRLESPRLFK